MKWRVRKPGAKQRLKNKKHKKWHLWFAWRPVRVPTRGRMSQQHVIWLSKVQRIGVRNSGYYDCGPYWFWGYKEK